MSLLIPACKQVKHKFPHPSPKLHHYFLPRHFMVALCRFYDLNLDCFDVLFMARAKRGCVDASVVKKWNRKKMHQAEDLRKEMQVMSRKQAEEHAQVMKELAKERTRTRDLQRAVAKQAWQSARADKGLSLSLAIQRKDCETAHRLLDEHDEDAMDCGVADTSGMTCLHQAARSVNKELVMRIKLRSPASMGALTYHSRTPSQWSVLNCLADVPKAKDVPMQLLHAELSRMLAAEMSVDALANVTGAGTTAVHQLVARGHSLSLQYVLECMLWRLGREWTSALINTQVGKHQLGAVDTALRCNRELVPILKRAGGVEMAVPQDDWKPNRRRWSGDGTCNARSDQKTGTR